MKTDTFFSISGTSEDLGCHLVELEEFFESNGLGVKLRYSLTLVVDEVVTNIFKYGFEKVEKGRVDVALAIDEERVAITITDNGTAFNPLAAPEPELDLPLEERRKPVGGMGIHLMRKLMDSCSYERKEHRNVLVLIKNLTVSQAPGSEGQPGKE